MPPKRRSVVSSARSRSNRDELLGAPFRLQTEQGTLRMGLDQFAELPMQSFQEELERHAVQNQFAGSLFPQQAEVRQQDAPIRNLVNTDFNLRNPRRAVIDSFIDVGNQSYAEQLKYAITKVEREIMSKRDFKNFLETDFAFSNVVPAIDALTTMMGRDIIPSPTPDEIVQIKRRIDAYDPTLLTDTRVIIQTVKSPDLLTYVMDKFRSVLKNIRDVATTINDIDKARKNAEQWLRSFMAILSKVAKD